MVMIAIDWVHSVKIIHSFEVDGCYGVVTLILLEFLLIHRFFEFLDFFGFFGLFDFSRVVVVVITIVVIVVVIISFSIGVIS